MKYILSCLLYVLSVSLCTAQRITFNKGGTNSINYCEEIPYEYLNGVIFINAEINGIKRKFLFDTGAPTQITPELFDELKPEIVNKTDITDAAGNKAVLKIVSLSALKLNELTFKDIPALVSGSEMYKCWHIDGVIGSNLLRQSIVQIAPSRHVIILTDDETKIAVNKKLQIPLTAGEPQSYPYFMTQINGRKNQLMGFDTGSQSLLKMTATHAKRFKKGETIEMIAAGYGTNSRSILGSQAPDSLYRLKIASLGIGQAVFTNVITETSTTRNSRIGAKILDYGTVTIDFIHHFFYFEPVTDHMDMTEKLWPLRPVIADNKLIAGVVWGNLSDQVRSGDQILKINDQSCENMDLCDWLNGMSTRMMEGNDTATLTVKDGKGTIRKILIRKE